MAILTFIFGAILGLVASKILTQDKEEELKLPPDVERYLKDFMNENDDKL